MFNLASTPPKGALNDRMWDVLVIGGGITGAGVMREAARLGLRVILVEKGDFASGTSSRSSKLVHGGLHYLARGQFKIARQSSRDRNRLLAAGPGLVEPLRFRVLERGRPRIQRCLVRACVGLYDSLYSSAWSGDAGVGPGVEFRDAQADDARLVLRVIREGCEFGGRAVNYRRVRTLLRNDTGRVVGAALAGGSSVGDGIVRARVVVNATGAWTADIAGLGGSGVGVQPLRGSHLVLPRSRLPICEAVVGVHPDTGRPLYAIPWRNVTLVGSTSVPHEGPLGIEPRISAAELGYLIRWVQAHFPTQNIQLQDVRSTFSGLRAIASSTRGAPSIHASRAHGIHIQPGMISVAGGKLTTFHSIAQSVLLLVTRQLGISLGRRNPLPLEPLPEPWAGLPFTPRESRRLMARYGSGGLDWIAGQPSRDRVPLPGTGLLPAELRWIVAREEVVHLDDLLLRRVRIGLTAVDGALPWVPAIRRIVAAELGWSPRRWREEIRRYERRWRWAHSVPGMKPVLARRRPRPSAGSQSAAGAA